MSDTDFQQRLIAERAELAKKAIKLDEFIAGDVFQALSQGQRTLLRKQSIAMGHYKDILSERIDLIKFEAL